MFLLRNLETWVILNCFGFWKRSGHKRTLCQSWFLAGTQKFLSNSQTWVTMGSNKVAHNFNLFASINDERWLRINIEWSCFIWTTQYSVGKTQSLFWMFTFPFSVWLIAILPFKKKITTLCMAFIAKYEFMLFLS